MWQSFFETLVGSGRGGGLFVAVLLGFFLTTIFWKLAALLALVLLAVWLLRWITRLIGAGGLRFVARSFRPPLDVFAPFCMFILALAGLVAAGLLRSSLSTDGDQALELLRLAVVTAAVIATSHSLITLRHRLQMNFADKLLYALVPVCFLLTIAMALTFLRT
jgi:hypothetical protein